jgi:hypothetical protein
LSVCALALAQTTTTVVPPTYAFNQSISYYSLPFLFALQIQDGLFIAGNSFSMFNMTTNQSISTLPGFTANCTDSITEFFFTATSNGTYFCANMNNGSLNQVDPLNNFTILNSYPYKGVAGSSIVDNEDYLLITPSSGMSFYVFSTQTGKYVCNNIELPINFNNVIGSVGNGTNLVYGQYDYVNGVFNFSNFSCASVTETYPNITMNMTLVTPPNNYGLDGQMIALNNSEVFVNLVQNGSVGQNVAIVASFANGGFMNANNFTQANGQIASFIMRLNSTNFVMAYSVNGTDYLGCFYVNASYAIVQTAEVNLMTNLNFNGMSIGSLAYVAGQNSLVLSIMTYTSIDPSYAEAAYLTVNLTSFTIIRAAPYWKYTYQPAVTLANGTTVEFGFHGQWLNTGGNITFNFMPSYGFYTYPTNGDVIWGLYTPNYNQITNLSTCTLLYIQLSTNNFTQIPLSGASCSCPGLYSGYYETYDFWLDSISTNWTNFNVTYRCSINKYNFVIDNSDGSATDISDDAVNPSVLTDWNNLILTVFDTYGENSMYAAVYDMNTGANINKTIIFQGQNGQTFYSTKINDSLITFMASLNETTTINVYSLPQYNYTYQQNVSLTNMSYIVPFGINNNAAQSPVQGFFLGSNSSISIYNYLGIQSVQATQLPQGSNYWPFPLSNNTAALWVNNTPVAFVNYYQLMTIGTETTTTSSASFSANISSSFLWVAMMLLAIIGMI